MLDNLKKNKILSEKLVQKLLDPVLMYTVVVMMSIMYHYRPQLTLVYGIAAYVLGFLIFRIFDFIDKHHVLGTFAYIGLFLAFVYLTGWFADIGSDDYVVGFGLWFFTPQDALDYNKWYTLALFMLFMLFTSSVIYYFTRIRYRIFMGFLIFIIPFVIYGKEQEFMPTIFIILMSVGYILLMVHFRELKNTDRVFIAGKKQVLISVTVFTFIFASAAAVIPKPEIEADRTALESMINAEQFTDKLVGMLGLFRSSSSGSQFRGVTNTSPLYYADSDDPLRIKTATFTNYNYSTDSWRIGEADDVVLKEADDGEVMFYDGRDLLEAILLVARNNSEFAEKYGLEDCTDIELDIPDTHDITLYSVYGETKAAPVPELAISLEDTSYEHTLFYYLTETLICSNGHDFEEGESFSYEYLPETVFRDKDNIKLIKAVSSLSLDEYENMLYDLSDILNEEGPDYDDDTIYVNSLCNNVNLVIDNNYKYFDEWLDYGDSEKIRGLAEQITKGDKNDYEKAKSLEGYFYLNDYIYDLNYAKGRSENVESFLFNTKRGVCYEYATAMVLLARAAGIPARYCEGFNMTERYDSERYGTNFVITSMASHGFPELYIKGYGWVSFEPTVTDMLAAPKEENAALPLAKAGVVILVIGILALIFVFIYPAVSHKLFMMRYSKREPGMTVKAVMYRIRKLYRVGRTKTAEETAESVRAFSGADITDEIVMFNRLVYGEEKLTSDEGLHALEVYLAAYTAYNEEKKKRKRGKFKRTRKRTEE